MNKHNVAWIVTIALVGSVAVCSQMATRTEQKLLSGEYGDRWPWPNHSHGYIDCRNVGTREVITIKLGSTTFGLNGPGQERFPDARSEMEVDEFGGVRLGATFSIISRASKICDEKKRS